MKNFKIFSLKFKEANCFHFYLEKFNKQSKTKPNYSVEILLFQLINITLDYFMLKIKSRKEIIHLFHVNV